MPTFEVTVNGKTFDVEAPDAQTAAKAAAKVAGGQSKPRGRGNDVAKSFGSGVVRGFSNMVAKNPLLDPLGFAGEQLGNLEQMFGRDRPSAATNALNNLSNNSLANAMGAAYKPQTTAGRYAKATGEFAPNALLGPAGGARGVVQQGLVRGAQVVVPAVASEGAADAVRAAGGGQGAQDAARVVGGLAGGVATSVRRPAPGAPRGPVPSVDDMRTRKTAAYQAVDDLGATYSPDAVTGMVDNIGADLAAQGFNPRRHKNTAAAVRELQKLRNKPLTLTEIDQQRQIIRRDVASTTDDAEKFMGERMIAKLDEFLATADNSQVIGAPADQAAAAITGARAANTQYQKVRAVDEAVTSATDRTGGTGSGGNIDNAIRQNLRRVLEKTKNLTPQERAAMRDIVRGGLGQNTLRAVGKFSPQNPLLGTGGAIAGTMAGGPLAGAAVPAIGYVAKASADAITKRKVSNLIRLMADGGPPAVKAEAALAKMAVNDNLAAQAYNQVAEMLLRAGAGGALAVNSQTESQ